MKLVKEILFEKFTEDSDPIKDMGIGNPFLKLKEGDHIKIIKSLFPPHLVYAKDINALLNAEGRIIYADYDKNYKITIIATFFNDGKIPEHINHHLYSQSKIKISLSSAPKYLQIIKRKVNEKFTEDSDPIADMGIGRFRPNRNFDSAKELIQEVYDCFPQILDSGKKLDWSTEESFKKNVQQFLDTPSKDNTYNSLLQKKLAKFKISYKWTVKKDFFDFWYINMRDFLESKNYNTETDESGRKI